MDDESIRDLVLWSFALLSLALFGAGWVHRVAGFWSDGARVIRLNQFGPFVWGKCRFDTGHQSFSGRMVFGHLKLNRRDWGDAHLRSLGFATNHLAAMQGASTGFFKLRLGSEGRLEGHFFGQTFTAREGKMVPTTLTEPQPRVWQRRDAHGITP